MSEALQWIWVRLTGRYSRGGGGASRARATGLLSVQQLRLEGDARPPVVHPSEHVEEDQQQHEAQPAKLKTAGAQEGFLKLKRVSAVPDLRPATSLERSLLWFDARLTVLDSLALTALFLVAVLTYCVLVYVTQVHRTFQDG